MAETSIPLKVEPKSAPAPAAPAPAAAAPFDQLRREIENVFDSFRTGFPFARRAFDFDLPFTRAGALAPATDMTERDTAYEISAELPGLDEKDVEVKLSGGILTLKGEKKEEREEKQKDYYLSERRYGAFTRSFRVPDGVDADKVEARFAKGVLTVTLPKTPKAQGEDKTIPVTGA